MTEAITTIVLTILFLLLFAGIDDGGKRKESKKPKVISNAVGVIRGIFFVGIVIFSLVIIALMLAGF
jgi:hypothetical protein